MKIQIISLLFILLLLPIAVAETGIVLNNGDIVQYKYDTNTTPTLKSGEYIVLYEDINSVFKGARYDGTKFVNPIPEQYEEITLEVKQNPLNPTQTIISGLTGAGAAYFMVRRLKPKGA